jgi:methylenetetrahydrofolate reductase (NADPH)
MRISQILKDNKSGVSFEFFPYKTPKGKEQLRQAVRALKNYNPLYMSMTYGAGGASQEMTKEAVYMFMEETDRVVMPHLTCIGATKSSIDSLLDEYKTKGIENIMALRGDIPRDAPDFDITKGEFVHARDLVSFVKQYGNFSIGVAVYPEGHIESASLEADLDYTRRKIDCGAEFAVTQMFFDNTFYHNFYEKCRGRGINIPIVPGIMPVTDLNKLRQFVSICRTTIPESLIKQVEPFLNKPQEMEKAGLEFTIKQCRGLLANGVKFLHFFTLNKAEVIKKIVEAIR